MHTLVDLVSTSAERFDRRPALLIRPSFRTRTWRYRDIAAAVPRVAAILAEAGVSPGDRVVIWSVNRPEWALAFLGVAHLGAVSVPIDVRHTLDFGLKVATQTEARVVVASSQTEAAARQLGIPVVLVERLPDLVRRTAPIPPASVAPEDLAEIVFTSGTTGEPKGAMLTHANLLWCASTMTDVMTVRPDDRLLSVLPLSHLYEQVLGLIGPLIVGASIVYPVSRQPAVLMRTFRDFKVSLLLIVPQGLELLDNAIQRRVQQAGRTRAFELLHRLARHLPRRARRILFRPVLGQFGGRLRTIGIGASSPDLEVARRWVEMGVEILQGYGATEMSPVVTFTRPERNVLESVGEPLPGVELRIAEDGEILARSPGCFLGYWHNEAATAAVIGPDGWYHSGDLGSVDADGMLHFRGRKKDMIALPDGQKVYPEDVEAVLRADPRLTDAVAVGWPPGPELRVHAVLLLADPSLADAIVRDANARLAPHQRIRGSTVWPDDDLPRTHTLKVKKPEVLARLARLADEEEAGRALAPAPADHLAGVPVDPVTALVASIAERPAAAIPASARLLSDLDLDSLRRVELLGVIEEELGVYIDDDALDPDATVADVIAMVARLKDAKRTTDDYRWPLSPVVRAVGLAFQALLMYPFVNLFYRVRTTGLERIAALEEPVLFTPNHCLHLDNAIILTRLPLAVRWKLSVAAGAETIYGNPVQGILASVIANAFPLAREGAVRRSLELLGARLDRGFNILIYPEGKLTVGGPLQAFKAGAGLIAVEGSTPVVPVKLNIHAMSLIDRRRLPAPIRGDVEFVVGDPIWFDQGTDAAVAAERLREAVAAL